MLCYLHVMQYICNYTTYSTARIAVLRCSYFVVRCMIFLVDMQLSCNVNCDYAGHCSWAVFCTEINAVQTKRNYKYTAINRAWAHIDCGCIAKSAVDVRTALGWSHPYTYLFEHLRFTMLILKKFVSENLIMTISTRLAFDIGPSALNIQYLSWNCVLSYNET